MKRAEIYQEIDELMTYCEGCFLQTYYRKTYSKTYAHRFCIRECTVGQNIQKVGKSLLTKKG